MPSCIEAVLFDFDGLILDTETPEVQAWQELFQRYGCQFPDECWQQMIGQSTPESASLPHRALEAALGKAVDPEVLEAECQARRVELIEGLPPVAGVIDTLDELERLGYRKAVVSSSSRGWVEGHLERLGLLGRFEAIVCGYEGLPSKPDPALYREALNRLRIDAANALALEDSPNGVRAAKAAGIYCVAIPNALTRLLCLDEADCLLPSLLDRRLFGLWEGV